MNVAITGGLGFIGSHLAEAFEADGHGVLVIDNLEGNVVDPTDDTVIMEASRWAFTIRRRPLDLVVHCAAPVGPGLVSERGGRLAQPIVVATTQLALACAGTGIPFVNVSSSEVYGATLNESPGEGDPMGHRGPFTARSEYGLAKLAAEAVVANTCERGKWFTVRPFNTAGPRQDASKGFVLPTFIGQAKRHESLTVYEPTARRSFTSVHDVAAFIANPETRDEAMRIGGSWNVGNDANECTIAELAQLVINTHISETGSDGKWHNANPISRWGVDYAFFQEENGVKLPNSVSARGIGWQPTWTLAEIVRDAYRSTS